ncbi:hypothetical protein ACFL04_04135 [Patescibacteria group bacterium]
MNRSKILYGLFLVIIVVIAMIPITYDLKVLKPRYQLREDSTWANAQAIALGIDMWAEANGGVLPINLLDALPAPDGRNVIDVIQDYHGGEIISVMTGAPVVYGDLGCMYRNDDWSFSRAHNKDGVLYIIYLDPETCQPTEFALKVYRGMALQMFSTAPIRFFTAGSYFREQRQLEEDA